MIDPDPYDEQTSDPVRTELSTREMFYGVSQDRIEQLDRRRRQYEAIHGPTDVTSHRIITEHPYSYQCAVSTKEPKKYLELIAPFYREILRENFVYAIHNGGLDTLPSELVPVAVAEFQEIPPPKAMPQF